MKKFHIISRGEPLMMELVSALKKKGYLVTFSSDLDKMEIIDKDTDTVIRPVGGGEEYPEEKMAKKMGIEVISFTEFIARQTKDKTRVVIRENRKEGHILPLVCFVLKKKNILYDLAAINLKLASEPRIQLSYDARIALLEGEREFDASVHDKIPSRYLYNPHILVMPRFQWVKDASFETAGLYFNFHKKLIALIERNGKFIFNAAYPALQELGASVREDVTALPYKISVMKTNCSETELETRYGKVIVNAVNEDDIADIFAAESVCRQLGVKGSDFFSLVGEYKFE
ncbi:MAG: hypothetical protein IJ338_03315 [Bacteroidaceae bacterium]|nr:hypothetical protein [Bacteroidaceae bacterium]